MPAYISIPLPSSVSQMLPTGRAQMQRQIGDLRERTGHWTGVTLSPNVSKCLPSISSPSPLTQQRRIPKYQWSFPHGVICHCCYIFVCSSDRESKDFALKWNRIEFIPNWLKWHGQSFVYWIDLCPICFRVHVHSTCSPPIELVFFTSLVSCLYEAWLLYLMSGELRSLCHNHSRTPDIGNTFSFMMNIFVTVKVC